MSTPGTDGRSAPKGFVARVLAAWNWVWWGTKASGQQQDAIDTMDAQRARAQQELDRMNAHRQTGRFDGGGTF